jgi:hypothetical protein
VEFFLSFLIALYDLTGFNTFSNTMIASRDYHRYPFSTKETVGGITSPALDKLVIYPHGKEIMLVYPWSHDQSNVVAFLNNQLIATAYRKA